jgi:hypothetical protein
MPQRHTFLAIELALAAQAGAMPLTASPTSTQRNGARNSAGPRS